MFGLNFFTSFKFLIIIVGNERETEINIMQVSFTGPPRVGKSSFWKRLLGTMPKKFIPSTDLTGEEGSVRLNVRGSCGFAVNVSKLDWKKIQAEEEFKAFITLITQTQDASSFKFENLYVHEESKKVLLPPETKGANDEMKNEDSIRSDSYHEKPTDKIIAESMSKISGKSTNTSEVVTSLATLDQGKLYLVHVKLVPHIALIHCGYMWMYSMCQKL